MAETASIKPANITGSSGRAKIIAADRDMLFEQYKMFVESADKISERRLAASSFFLTVNTVIIGASGFSDVSAGYINFAGVILCAAWFTLIKSYKRLNAEKFKIIHDIEKSLPRAPFKEEWDALDKKEHRKSYKHFSDVEQYVPLIFGFLHATLILPSAIALLKQALTML